MKCLLWSLVLTTPAFGRTVQINCTAPAVNALNKFTTVGKIEMEDDGSSQGELTTTLTPSGNEATPIEMHAHKVRGTGRVLPPGYSRNEVISFTVKAESNESVVYTLNTGLEGPGSSRVLINGREFKANCK